MENKKEEKIKVDDGPFIGSNVNIIKDLFKKSVDQNRHGGYKINKNKWVAFIYLAIQRSNGEWTLPPEAPRINWLNKPNRDNSEFIRECYEEDLKRLFSDPADEYAVFKKTGRNECFFYGIFKLKEVKRDYIECVFKRINTELKFDEWK
jgi:hypothetical protein